MRSGFRLTCILLVAASAAAVINGMHPRGISWFVPKDQVYPQPTVEQKAAEIDRDQVVSALERGAIVIDARKADRYAKGHIPGAVNMPAEDVQAALGRLPDLALVDDCLVLYCGGDECDESRMLFDRLKENGYANLRIYFGGWRDWTEHDMPVERQESQ